ncbi:MAG: C45 family autoproteolytic acyltransferase/hydrolase [Promethearchaeota archaeon]
MEENNNIQQNFFNFILFEGTHREMGVLQGRKFAKNIKYGLNILREHEEINQLRPKLMPKSFFLKLAASKAYKGLEPIFERNIPNQAERIRGIAEGAEISLEFIYLLLSSEILLGEPDFEIPIEKGCTSIAYSASKTARNHVMISRNFDFERFVLDLLCLRHNKPHNLYESWDLSATPLPGTFNGINEKGVFIATNEAFPIKEVDVGLPASAIIQEALENCATANEVFDLVKELPRGSGNIFCVADSDGNIFAIEYTSKRIYKREMKKGYLITTNHYVDKNLVKIDIPRNAILGKRAPKELRGIAFNETSYIRMETAQKILESKEKFDIQDMKALHRDHSNSKDNKGGMNSICHHDPINITAASMIFDLNSFEAWICKGVPCENEYIYFNLKEI